MTRGKLFMQYLMYLGIVTVFNVVVASGLILFECWLFNISISVPQVLGLGLGIQILGWLLRPSSVFPST